MVGLEELLGCAFDGIPIVSFGVGTHLAGGTHLGGCSRLGGCSYLGNNSG